MTLGDNKPYLFKHHLKLAQDSAAIFAVNLTIHIIFT